VVPLSIVLEALSPRPMRQQLRACLREPGNLTVAG
jgi:hypothetical protein